MDTVEKNKSKEQEEEKYTHMYKKPSLKEDKRQKSTKL